VARRRSGRPITRASCQQANGFNRPAIAGDSIKPGVKRSGTPRSNESIDQLARDSGRKQIKDTARGIISKDDPFVAAAARFAGSAFNAIVPGDHAPGRGPRPSSSAGVRDFMLSPRFAGSRSNCRERPELELANAVGVKESERT